MQESASSSSPTPQGGNAKVRYGIYSKQGESIAGRSIADLRTEFGGVWGITDDASAYNGTQKLDENYVVGANDNIEFHRRSGEKG